MLSCHLAQAEVAWLQQFLRDLEALTQYETAEAMEAAKMLYRPHSDF